MIGHPLMPGNPDTSLWTKLKTQVMNSNYTAMTVAAHCSIPWVRFSSAQTGKTKLTPEEYERVALLLDLHPIDLLGFNDPDLEIVSIEAHRERNARQRREREAIAKLRKSNPALYEQIVYGSDDADGGDSGQQVSNGSGR